MRKLLGALTDNWKLKLLALALAVLLWVVVSAEQVTSNWIPVPLRVQVADPGYRVVDASVPSEVEVRFTGPGRDFLDLAIRRSPLVLRIEEVSDVQEAFVLEPEMVQVPAQLSVNPQDVRPRRIGLRFTRLEDRSVPVEVRIRNELGSEWTLVDSLRVEPSRVRVRGPAELVGGVEAVRTERITLSPGDSVFSRQVPLDTAALEGVRLSASRVLVSGMVDRIHERTLESVPVSIGPGVTLRPSTVDVRLRGPEQRVRAIDVGSFRVVVAIDSIPARIPEAGATVPVRIEGLPPGLSAEPNPRTIRLIPVRREPPEPIGTEAADTARAGEGP